MQFAALAFVALAAFGAGTLVIQDKQPERFTHPLSKDADGGMARWMKTWQPGPAHKRLAELLGTYDVTLRMTMSPNAPPMVSKGECVIDWFADGKWLQARSKIDLLGQKVSGLTLLGYDNFKERYVSCRIDSMETSMATSFGHFDGSGDNLILWGTIDEPATPEQDKQVRYIYRGFGQDKFTLEVHDMMIGETNTKVLEFEYVRRK